MDITMRNKTVDDDIKSKWKFWIYQISKIMPEWLAQGLRFGVW